MNCNFRFVEKKDDIIKVQFFGEDESILLNEKLNEDELSVYQSEWSSICWEFDNIERKIEFPKGTVVQASLNFDKKYIVLVYKKESLLYPAPNNCVVYNLDGSIHKIISTPILKVPDEKGNFNKGYAFTSLGWTKNKDNKLVMYLYVLEEKPGWVDWYEEMEFDAESGEFGELLSRSGR